MRKRKMKNAITPKSFSATPGELWPPDRRGLLDPAETFWLFQQRHCSIFGSKYFLFRDPTRRNSYQYSFTVRSRLDPPIPSTRQTSSDGARYSSFVVTGVTRIPLYS